MHIINLYMMQKKHLAIEKDLHDQKAKIVAFESTFGSL